MTAPAYPTALKAATWTTQMAAHKAPLAKARLKLELVDTLKALERAHVAVDWELFATVGLATAEDAVQRKADLEAERSGPVKALLKLATQAGTEVRPVIASFKAEPALKGDAARLASDLAAAVAAYARSVGDALESACSAVEKRRLALSAAAKQAKAPAVDPKLAKLAAAVRSRLVAGLKAVRNAQPGQPPLTFIAAVAAAHARVVIGPKVGNAQKTQLMALLPQQDGLKWMKGDCVWEDKAVTFICTTPVSGSGKRLQRALLEQTKAKLRVRVRKPDGEAELCEGSDDPAALEATDGDDGGAADAGSATTAPVPTASDELKTRRLVEESTLRVRMGALLPAISLLADAGQRRDHAARLVKLREAVGKLGGLTDAAAVKAIGMMLAKVAEQQAQLEAARQARVAGKPARKGPQAQDLSDPVFAKKVMALLTPAERASLKTKADYDWAVSNYHEVMRIRGELVMPDKLQLTPVSLDIRAPQIVEDAQKDKNLVAESRVALRRLFAVRGYDLRKLQGLDDGQAVALWRDYENAERLASDPLANDGLGDSKGAVNHFLDGVEHGLGKVGHDIGNLGLAAKFVYDTNTGKAQLEEPQWFGAAGRTRGQNQSYAGLAWELAGNVPIIGRAQLLYGMTEMAKGAWKGDWNNVAYGLGNMGGALMFGHMTGKLPLEPGKFSDTRMGRAYEGGKTFLFGKPQPPARPRINPAHLGPNDDGGHMPLEVPSHAFERYSNRTPSGLRVEVTPRIAGSASLVDPDLAGRFQSAAKAVEGLLPKGRKIATPEGKPLTIEVNPKDVIPYMDRQTGTVHMHPDLDGTGQFPKKGPGAAMSRWAPKPGDKMPSEIIMQHELGHAAMPEIGTRLAANSRSRMELAFKKMLGMGKPEDKLKGARLEREKVLVEGLDELGADTFAAAAAKDLQATPKAVAEGIARALEAHARDPKANPLPPEFPKDPVEWMKRRDFSDGGTIPKVGEEITPYDVFSGVRRHLGQHYGDALTGKDAPKVIGALMASNERFMKALDAEPGLLDSDYAAANKLFIGLFDAEAAKLGLVEHAH
ncbi:MAG: hypothetical protein ACKVQR_00725 [Aquabacterium sp.]